MDSWAGAMAGRYILIVEDDYLIATDMAVSLEAMGAHILGPVASVRDGGSALCRGRGVVCDGRNRPRHVCAD